VIRGKAIRLRTVRETDLDRLYTLLTDLANRGDFVAPPSPVGSYVHTQFHETGFWSEDSGRFLIVNTADEIIGSGSGNWKLNSLARGK
jgi:hypothetical protein